MPAPDSPLQTDVVVSVPFDENTFLLWLDGSQQDGSQQCVVVDPGLQPGAIVAKCEEHRLTPAALLITHGHSDHIAGNAALKERYPDAPIVIGRGDAPKLTDPVTNLSANFGFELVSPEADVLLDEGETYEAAGLRFEVLDTPGHSAGHVTYVCRVADQTHVISGDVLFRGSIGRTDFPDGNFEDLRRAVHEKLFPLGDDAIVYAGHGPKTTIGEERAGNPFVGRPAGYDV